MGSPAKRTSCGWCWRRPRSPEPRRGHFSLRSGHFSIMCQGQPRPRCGRETTLSVLASVSRTGGESSRRRVSWAAWFHVRHAPLGPQASLAGREGAGVMGARMRRARVGRGGGKGRRVRLLVVLAARLLSASPGFGQESPEGCGDGSNAATSSVCRASSVPPPPPNNFGPGTPPPPTVGSGNWAALNFDHLVRGESQTGWNFTSSNPSVVQMTQNNGTSTLLMNFLSAGSSRITVAASNSCGSRSRSFTITVSPAPPR